MFSLNSIALPIFVLSSLPLVGCGRESPAASTSSQAALPAPAPSAAASVSPASVSPASPASPAALTLLPVGADVPDLTAPAQDGKLVNLRALKGKPLVVYFYPKDDTPGCTVEAKGIRDQYAELSRLAVVLGVSEDPIESHKAFASKYDLPFSLLVDDNHALATAFGVPLSASGNAKRVTFVIDASGKVKKVFPSVDPQGHAAELIEALKALG